MATSITHKDGVTIVTDEFHGTFTLGVLVEGSGVNRRTLIFPLTKCCSASAKYMDTGVPGAAEVLSCRGCYEPVEDRYAYCAEVGSATYLEDLGAMMTPCKAVDFDCVAELAWQIEEYLGRPA